MSFKSCSYGPGSPGIVLKYGNCEFKWRIQGLAFRFCGCTMYNWHLGDSSILVESVHVSSRRESLVGRCKDGSG